MRWGQTGPRRWTYTLASQLYRTENISKWRCWKSVIAKDSHEANRTANWRSQQRSACHSIQHQVLWDCVPGWCPGSATAGEYYFLGFLHAVQRQIIFLCPDLDLRYFTGCCIEVDCWYNYVCIVSKFNYHVADMDWLKVWCSDNEWGLSQSRALNFTSLNVCKFWYQSLIAALVLCWLDCSNGTLVGLPAYLVHSPCTDSSWCRTQMRDWYFVFVDLFISRMHSSVSIGCECQKGLFSRSLCRLIGLSLAMPRSTYGSSHRSPTSCLDKDCGLLHPTIYSFLLLDCLLLDVVPSLSRALTHETTYLHADVTSAPSLLTFKND